MFAFLAKQWKRFLGISVVSCVVSTPLYGITYCSYLNSCSRPVFASAFFKKKPPSITKKTKQVVCASCFSNFENLYFDNSSAIFFTLGRDVDIARSFNVSDRRGYFWAEAPRLNCGQSVAIPGITIMAFDSRGAYGHSVHFFHFLEHLLGIWEFGGRINRLDVRLFLLAGDGITPPEAFDGATEYITDFLIKALFPNAIVKKWNRFIAETQGQILCFEKAITSDRSMDVFKTEPYCTDRMLGGYFQDLKKESLDCLAAYVWDYSKVVKARPEELTVTYIQRRYSRKLVPDCERDLIRKLAELPNVKLQVIDFATIPFDEQVCIVANTDVLLGVHGNGLSHTLFLPNGATLIEIFPVNSLRVEYRILAQARGLNYFGWIDQFGWVNAKLVEERGCYGEINVQELATNVDAIVEVVKNVSGSVRSSNNE